MHFEVKETKNVTVSTVKGTFPLAFSVQFYTINNFAEPQLLSMMELSFDTLPRKFSIASLLKSASDFIGVFFVRKGALQLNISTKKDTTKDKNINISSSLKYFENLRHFLNIINIPAQYYKNSFKIFYKKLELLEITQKSNRKIHAQN